jgi:hypothetical protein
MVTPAGMPMRRSTEFAEFASACLKFLDSSLPQTPEQVFFPLALVAAM